MAEEGDSLRVPDLVDDPDGFSRTRIDLEQWRAGDRSALDRLFRRYAQALRLIVSRRRANIANPATRARLSVDDLVNEAAATIITKLADFEYRGPGSLQAWMEQIALHKVSDAMDHLQAQKRAADLERPLSSEDDSRDSIPSIASRAEGPSTMVERSERSNRVQETITALPERAYRIVLLRHFFGAEWGEIARVLGLESADAVRKEHARTLQKLASSLRDL